MYETRHEHFRMLHRLITAVFLFVVFLGGCSGHSDSEENSTSAPENNSGRVAASLSERINFLLSNELSSQAMSERQKTILRHALQNAGVVSKGDYDKAWANFQQCMTSKGYTRPRVPTDGNGLRSALFSPFLGNATEQQQNRFHADWSECYEQEYMAVDEVYRMHIGNPNLLSDPTAALVDCLHKYGLVPKSYTITQYRDEERKSQQVFTNNLSTSGVKDANREALRQFTFDTADPQVSTCLVATGKDGLFRDNSDESDVWRPFGDHSSNETDFSQTSGGES